MILNKYIVQCAKIMDFSDGSRILKKYEVEN